MPSENARDWLKGKTLEDLEIIEFGGRNFFQDKILKAKKGGFEEFPVMVCVPREPEIAKARVEAVELFRKRKLDRKEDEDLFAELDMLCQLARAIRTLTPPHGQYMPVEHLIGRTDPKTGESEGFDIPSLHDLWERVQTYRKLIDPRIYDPSIEEVFAACDAIAKVRNLSPLVAIAGPDVDSFVITIASTLSIYRTQLRSWQSNESETPEPSQMAS